MEINALFKQFQVRGRVPRRQQRQPRRDLVSDAKEGLIFRELFPQGFGDDPKTVVNVRKYGTRCQRFIRPDSAFLILL